MHSVLFWAVIATQVPTTFVDGLQAVENVPGHLCVVVARRELAVSSQVGGVLASVNVSLGEQVRSGQTLFRLDEEVLQHELSMARATVRSATAELARAQVAHGQAKLRYERRRDADGVYSPEEVDMAHGQAEIAEAELQAAEAQLSEQQARLALLEASLRHVRVVAPFDGVIAACLQQPGATLQPGVAVVRLISASAPLLRFAVPPSEATRYSPGTDVEVILAGRPQPLRGRVLGLAPAVDPAIDMVPVEAELVLRDAEARDVRVGTVGKVRPSEILVPSR